MTGELALAGNLVLVFVATAGLAFSLARPELLVRGRAARASALVAFGCLTASAFVRGTAVTGDRTAPVLSLTVVGLVALAGVAAGWSAGRWGCALIVAGGAVLALSEVAADDLARLTDWLRVVGAGALGAALLRAARRSISMRVAAASTAIVLVVVLAVSLAVSSVMTRTVEREAIHRFDRAAATEADLASRRGITATASAQILAAAVAGGDLGRSTLRLASDAGPPEQLAADAGFVAGGLDVLVRRFVRDVDPRVGAVVLINPGGGVEAAVPVDAAENVELAGQSVVREALATQTSRQSVVLVGDRGYGAAAEPVFVTDAGMRRFGGVVAVTSRLDDSYVESRVASEAREVDGYGVALATAGRVLAATGPRTRLPAWSAVAERAIASGDAEDAFVGGRFLVAAPVVASDGVPVMAVVVSVPTTTIERARVAVLRSVFGVALVAAVVAVVLAGLVGGRIGSGVRRLTAAATGIRRGQLDVSAGVTGSDELGVLSETFDSMAGSLRRMTGDLRDAADAERRLRSRIETIVSGIGEALVAVDERGVVTDFNAAAEELFGEPAASVVGSPLDDAVRVSMAAGVDLSDRLRRPLDAPSSQPVTVVRADGEEVPAVLTAGPLRDATDRVVGAVLVLRDVRQEREVERMKSEFLATIGHELRTPLTPIKGYTGLLRRPSLPDVRVDEFAREIERGVDHLERTVGQLVNFATIVAGRLDLRREPVAVGPLLDRVALRWRARVDADRHAILRSEAADVPPVDADPRYLEQALDELVDNAVKYSPDGGAVTLWAAVSDAHDGRRVRVCVADEGVGVSPDQLSDIFGAFAQANSSLTRRFGGLGLGLALVGHIARSHGGELECRPGAGKGTTFSIVLPVHGDAPGAPVT